MISPAPDLSVSPPFLRPSDHEINGSEPPLSSFFDNVNNKQSKRTYPFIYLQIDRTTTNKKHASNSCHNSPWGEELLEKVDGLPKELAGIVFLEGASKTGLRCGCVELLHAGQQLHEDPLWSHGVIAQQAALEVGGANGLGELLGHLRCDLAWCFVDGGGNVADDDEGQG